MPRKNPRHAACALLLAFTAAAIAQNALDNNLSVEGRTNNARPAPAVSRDVYTLNRATGDYRYNRANAFNDPTYSIYQRHTSDRFDAAHAAGVSTGATAAIPFGRASNTAYSTPGTAARPAPTTARQTAFGSSFGSTSSSSSTRQRTQAAPARTLAPAYDAATYSGGTPSRETVPAERSVVTLSDRRGEYAPPRTKAPDGAVRARGYSVADDAIWPWLAK